MAQPIDIGLSQPGAGITSVADVFVQGVARDGLNFCNIGSCLDLELQLARRSC